MAISTVGTARSAGPVYAGAEHRVTPRSDGDNVVGTMAADSSTAALPIDDQFLRCRIA